MNQHHTTVGAPASGAMLRVHHTSEGEVYAINQCYAIRRRNHGLLLTSCVQPEIGS
jgi:hypothetical protein